MLTPRGKIVVGVLVAIVAAGSTMLALAYLGDEEETPPSIAQEDDAPCGAPRRIVHRVARGYYPGRSGDVLAVERLPHQFGTRHSGPHPYTQDVPIVLYGPGYIRAGQEVDGEVTVADLAPTYAELLGFDGFPERSGRVLDEALLPEAERNGTPKLIFTLVWDGGGDNVLEQWPDSWPELKELMANGTSYPDAIVGSSPSITPAIHANIGTGAFPREHGLPDIKMRVGRRIVDSWEGDSPQHLELETLADLWDRAQGNAPLIGVLARDDWHVGMIGHGSMSEGGDSDIAILDNLGGTEFTTIPEFYSLPEYVLGKEGLSDLVDEVDRADGELDGEWLGNAVDVNDGKVRYTPAWPPFQTNMIERVLRNEGFGTDDVADLFYTNYKGSDLAGHEWNMVEPEVREVVEAQDAEIPRLVALLDELVGKDSYVLALTADHGMTPYPKETGGWSIDTKELTADIEAEFNPNLDAGALVASQRGYQIMLDRKRARAVGVTGAQVAEFLESYTVRDNVDRDSRSVFESQFSERADEKLYLAAFTPKTLQAALDCVRSG